MSGDQQLLALIRLGIGHSAAVEVEEIDWNSVKALAEEQGLNAVVLDGIEKLPTECRPTKTVLVQWIGEVLQSESVYAVQQKAAAEMALLFHENKVRTYVLKGIVVSECYPKPEHRYSSDMDCYLLPETRDFDAWSLGNDLVRANGFDVVEDFYKNSTIYLPGLTVENHKYLTPFRGNKRLQSFEIMLQSMIKGDSLSGSNVEERRFEGTWLYRPPVMVSALFLIEHAYSHFLHEGLKWRMVLDWMMFSRKHKDEIDWNAFDSSIDEFGFRRFYDSFERLGRLLLGDIDDVDLGPKDKKMLDDVWDELHLTESYHGFKAKVSFAFNTMRSWWKYHYFSEISMIRALWIQVKGFLFIKNPKMY